PFTDRVIGEFDSEPNIAKNLCLSHLNQHRRPSEARDLADRLGSGALTRNVKGAPSPASSPSAP
ncbi:MAG: hypothetical protein AB7V13_27080, partial [Pseudorhodoplanes sp.]